MLLQSLEDLAHLEPHACLIRSNFLHMSIKLLGNNCICAYYGKAELIFAHLLDCIMPYAENILNILKSAIQFGWCSDKKPWVTCCAACRSGRQLHQARELSEVQVQHPLSSARQSLWQHSQEPVEQ